MCVGCEVDRVNIRLLIGSIDDRDTSVVFRSTFASPPLRLYTPIPGRVADTGAHAHSTKLRLLVLCQQKNACIYVLMATLPALFDNRSPSRPYPLPSIPEARVQTLAVTASTASALSSSASSSSSEFSLADFLYTQIRRGSRWERKCARGMRGWANVPLDHRVHPRLVRAEPRCRVPCSRSRV